MTRLRRLTAFALVVFLALRCRAASALTEQQVIERARKFLQDVGREIPADEPKVSRLTGDFEPGSWKVCFGHDLVVEVSDVSSRIMAFFDNQAIRRSKAADRPISPEEARRLAAEYMEAAGGLPGEAVWDRAKPLPAPGPAALPLSGHPAAWSVGWKRYTGGLEVRPDQLVVDVDAATGRLLAFRNHFLTPPPPSLEPLLSRAQAEAIARRDVPQVADRRFDKAYLFISARGFGSPGEPFHRTSVLAWHLQSPLIAVSLDARTGEVLATSMTKGNGGWRNRRPDAAAAEPRHALESAQRPADAPTEQQIIERARKFLRDIGREAPARPVQVLGPSGRLDPDFCEVYFGQRVHVRLSYPSGTVVAFTDYEMITRRSGSGNRISARQARRFAARYIKAAGGLPKGATLDRVEPVPASDDPVERQARHPVAWRVCWKRYMAGYEVQPDELLVNIDATTGHLRGLYNGFVTHPPPSLQPLITRARAEAIARKSVPGGARARFDNPYLVILGLSRLAGEKPAKRESVLAWYFRSAPVSVWVDARTGQVVEVSRPMPYPRGAKRVSRGYHSGVAPQVRWIGLLCGAIAIAAILWLAVARFGRKVSDG